MNIRISLYVLIGVCMTLSSTAQKIEYTKRSKNEVREGPGNYYPLIVVLRAGIEVPILEMSEGWVKFYKSFFSDAREGTQGAKDWWISKNCLVDKPSGGRVLNLELGIKSAKASPSVVTAAIRGFAIRYGKINAPVVDSLLAGQEMIFSPQEYSEFKKEIASTRSIGKAIEDEATYLHDYESSVSEDGIGLGIAGRIASVGLVRNRDLTKYLNLLATIVGEASGAYDVSFKVFVTQEQDPKAFSVPGGYIFISEGLLKLCADEAELAGVIAHEIIHIVVRHGLRETYERRHRIRAEEVFEELEEEVGGEQDTTVAELEEFAQEAYDAAVKPRLQTYEEEADRGAVVLLVKTGYDPMAVSRMILKVRDAIRATPPRRLEDNPFAHLDFEKRNTELLKYMQKNMRVMSGVKNTERFRRWVR